MAYSILVLDDEALTLRTISRGLRDEGFEVLLAMSGEETLAQVYREIGSPKLKNLKKTALIIALYSFSFIFTGISSLLVVMIIPDADAAGLRQLLQPRRHVHPVAKSRRQQLVCGGRGRFLQLYL